MNMIQRLILKCLEPGVYRSRAEIEKRAGEITGVGRPVRFCAGMKPAEYGRRGQRFAAGGFRELMDSMHEFVTRGTHNSKWTLRQRSCREAAQKSHSSRTEVAPSNPRSQRHPGR